MTKFPSKSTLRKNVDSGKDACRALISQTRESGEGSARSCSQNRSLAKNSIAESTYCRFLIPGDLSLRLLPYSRGPTETNSPTPSSTPCTINPLSFPTTASACSPLNPAFVSVTSSFLVALSGQSQSCAGLTMLVRGQLTPSIRPLTRQSTTVGSLWGEGESRK